MTISLTTIFLLLTTIFLEAIVWTAVLMWKARKK
jgi:hypothetical protein